MTHTEMVNSILKSLAWFGAFRKINVIATKIGDRYVSSASPGISDIIGCVRGHFVAVEAKAKWKKQSKDQKLFQFAIESAGGIYILALSVEDAILPIKEIYDRETKRIRASGLEV